MVYQSPAPLFLSIGHCCSQVIYEKCSFPPDMEHLETLEAQLAEIAELRAQLARLPDLEDETNEMQVG